MNVIVSAQGLGKAFGTQGEEVVLRGLDWQIERGQVVGLLGRNGAGKTTLIESLLGLRDIDHGDVRLFGYPSAALPDDARARLGYVPQQTDLFDWLKPREMLDYFRAFYPRWHANKVDALLIRWGIDVDRPIAQLSVGQQQRLSIIRALAHEPELLILDEPVSSLDPAARRDFLRELVDQVVSHGTTVLFSTHILSDIERVAMDVAVLKGGKIALQASLDELIETTHRITGAAQDVDRLVAHPLSRRQTRDGVSALAQLTPAEIDALHTERQVAVETLSLEDLFIEVTQA